MTDATLTAPTRRAPRRPTTHGSRSVWEPHATSHRSSWEQLHKHTSLLMPLRRPSATAA